MALRDGAAVAPGPTPRDLRNNQTTVQTGVVYDDKPLWLSFGGVVTNARASYTRGQTVSVKFWGGHPKNNLRRQGTFLQVQRKSGTSWSDGGHTTGTGRRSTAGSATTAPPTLACSHVTIEWTIPPDAPPGTYRIRHEGTGSPAGTGGSAPTGAPRATSP